MPSSCDTPHSFKNVKEARRWGVDAFARHHDGSTNGQGGNKLCVKQQKTTKLNKTQPFLSPSAIIMATFRTFFSPEKCFHRFNVVKSTRRRQGVWPRRKVWCEDRLTADCCIEPLRVCVFQGARVALALSIRGGI